MKYKDLNIQTQREFPNNARTQGFGWLVRAGYVTRENEALPLGQHAMKKLLASSKDPSYITGLSLPLLKNDRAVYFPLATGDVDVAHCPACKYTEQLALAQFKKTPLPREEELPLEKVSTPDCSTIESLASFMGLPKEKTAKALMYTRLADKQFVFVVVRGDMQASEAKLNALVGEVRAATAEEITAAGAVAGYASPVGLKNALIVADDLITQSQNLVAGANDAGYHLKNTNTPRDYTAHHIADMVQARQGDPCPHCGGPLSVEPAIILMEHADAHPANLLLALAETYHDDKGLAFPEHASPFDVYLMHVPGKTMDTKARAEEIHNTLQTIGVSVLFDDRDERAGVKFNDADLIGCPIRITVGEKVLQNGMVEIKRRNSQNGETIPLEQIPNIKTLL